MPIFHTIEYDAYLQHIHILTAALLCSAPYTYIPKVYINIDKTILWP